MTRPLATPAASLWRGVNAAIRGNLERFVRFGLVGVCGVALNFGIYSGLVLLGLHYILASWIGWIIAFAFAFEMNRRFVFAYKGEVLRALVKSLGVYLAQQIAMTVMLFAGVELIGLSEVAAFFFALPVAVMISFIGLKLFAFADRGRHSEADPAASPTHLEENETGP